jgi:hypothetical protein
MKDVICVKITKSHIYDCATKRIGRKGENLSTCFEITLDNDLVNLDVFMEFLKPNGESLATPKLELINNVATYDVPLYLLDTAGELKAQIVLRNTETGKVWKTYIKKYLIEDGICACDDIPDKEDWITHAENLLDQIEKGLTPTIGENGNWFILDKDTGKPARGEEGKQGPKGDAGSIKFIVVSELPTEDIDESAIYLKPVESEDTQNSYEEYIYVNGLWESLGIAQVEVNLEDYVKNTDYATESKAGVMKIASDRGAFIQNGYFYIRRATNEDIDDKSNAYRPIVPANLNYAVGSVKASETQSGSAKMWTSQNENGEIGLNISTEV